MSIHVTATQIVTYQNNVELALQQKKSKLGVLAVPVQAKGKRHELTNLIGSVKPTRGTVRHGDTQYSDTPHDRRWVAKTPSYDYADLVDDEDRLRGGIDLQGAYTMAAAATMARAEDQAFIEGYYGIALTGEEGGTQVAFPAGNIIGVSVGASGATGMNVAKLRAARKKLTQNLVDLDEEELLCAITAEQADDLLEEVKATSADFVSMGGAPVMESGRLRGLLGFKFVDCEYGNSASFDNTDLTVDGSGYRRVMAWAKSGMALAEWMAVKTSVDRLPQKRNSVQVFATRHLTATRTQEGKCLQILCSEA